MVFLCGPRQVGKTTISQACRALTDHFVYLNWDNLDHQALILGGPQAIVDAHLPNLLTDKKPIIVFDELHKYTQWKVFLKGFYDTYKERTRIIVTGSARLDLFQKGGDSLMGRYFSYHIHPLSIREIISSSHTTQFTHMPAEISDEAFTQLFNRGGFPEPFLNDTPGFYQRWQTLQHQQLFREDILEMTHIQEINRLELLASLIKHQTGQLTNYNNLANKARVSVDTIRRWMNALESFYYLYTITPWSTNIARSLIKTPVTYLWDWSKVTNQGARFENFIAAHLHKAIHFWNDTGQGEFSLHYLRDKDKHEVDFVVVRDQQPWMLVEAKLSSNESLSKSLYHFQKQLNAPHAFQVVYDLPYVNEDCFQHAGPIIVPARTFCSQLI